MISIFLQMTFESVAMVVWIICQTSYVHQQNPEELRSFLLPSVALSFQRHTAQTLHCMGSIGLTTGSPSFLHPFSVLRYNSLTDHKAKMLHLAAFLTKTMHSLFQTHLHPRNQYKIIKPLLRCRYINLLYMMWCCWNDLACSLLFCFHTANTHPVSIQYVCMPGVLPQQLKQTGKWCLNTCKQADPLEITVWIDSHYYWIWGTIERRNEETVLETSKKAEINSKAETLISVFWIIINHSLKYILTQQKRCSDYVWSSQQQGLK